MTVCVAAIARSGLSIIGAADRMITAHEVIEFQPDSPEMGLQEGGKVRRPTKLIPLTKSAIAMIAGDLCVQAEIISNLMSGLPGYDLGKIIDIRTIADRYRNAHDTLLSRRAEQEILSPLGLNLNSYIRRNKELNSELAIRIAKELDEFELPGTETIIAGIDDDGAHLFVIMNGRVSREDITGFAAVGSGYHQAESHLMVSGHSREVSAFKALYDVFVAKKHAESARGVGEQTDMFLIEKELPEPLFIYQDTIISMLDERYAAAETIAKETNKMVHAAIEQRFDDLKREVAKKEKEVGGDKPKQAE